MPLWQKQFKCEVSFRLFSLQPFSLRISPALSLSYLFNPFGFFRPLRKLKTLLRLLDFSCPFLIIFLFFLETSNRQNCLQSILIQNVGLPSMLFSFSPKSKVHVLTSAANIQNRKFFDTGLSWHHSNSLKYIFIVFRFSSCSFQNHSDPS